MFAVLTVLGIGPISFGEEIGIFGAALAGAVTGAAVAYSAARIVNDLPFGAVDRHEFEHCIIRFLTGFGFVVFTAAVLIPFGVMVATSLKSQQELLQNPLDYSIDFSKGWGLLRSYRELFADFNFGSYLWTSFYVSVITVFRYAPLQCTWRLRRGALAFRRAAAVLSIDPSDLHGSDDRPCPADLHGVFGCGAEETPSSASFSSTR